MEKKSDEKGFYDKATTSELMRYAANGIRAWAKGPIAGVASSMADELEMRAAAIEVIERKANCPNCEDGGCNDCLPEPYDSEAR